MPINKIFSEDSFHKFTITRHPKLFKDDQYILSYRLVLLHSLRSYWQNGGNNAKLLIESMLDVINTHKGGIYKKKCLELYPFEKDNQIGFIFIDRSKACFPLVFYPSDDKVEHKDRVPGLVQALKDIEKNLRSYEEILREAVRWNESLVNTLKQKFTPSTPQLKR